jgi:hypothetical protein
MPNGYTANIYEGKPESVRQFLMKVGRGMGFAILQRDDDWDTPIHKVEPSDYNARRLEESRERLRELEGVSIEEANRRAKAEYDEAVAAWEERRSNREAMRSRYEQRIREVEAWQPDPLVESVKNHALQYLREGMEFDCGKPGTESRWDTYPKRLGGADWLNEQRAKALHDVEYHEKENRKEIERAEERNRYIEAFLSSLPDGAATVA